VQFTAVGQTKPGGDLHPGDTLQFMMPFHVDARTSHFSRDWSIFIHLENADGLIVWQRDVYPGQGKYATSLMNGEMLWYNRFAVSIPDHAYAPQSLRVYMGMYDLHSGARMISQGSGASSDNHMYLGTIRLIAREDSSLPGIPNPMHVNFGGEAELLGYDVSRLAVYPGQPITVTLYWRPIHPLTTDYHVFTQILMPGTSNVVGSSDSMPDNYNLPTTTWKPGEIVKDAHTFTLHADASPDNWQLIMGLYQLASDNSIHHLRIITPDGGQADDTLSLTRIRVAPLPESF
ncbi:MAG TPA: hypothetical protein VKQ72_21525, partial [Aggregatilineales bacterium]|nr:hypothetical protein [Aggregatilineales bacterium]